MPLNPQQIAQYRGHPTAPGPRDPYTLRGPIAETDSGVPGKPRLRPTPASNGPGIPGHTPAGPMQPEVEYEETNPTYVEPSTQLIRDIGKQGPFAS